MNIHEAIEIIEDFKAMDDWTAVYCPPMHKALDVVVNEALRKPKLTWTPCSERLPPLGEEVLVWAYDRCYLLTLYAYPNNEGYYWSVEDYNVADDAFDKIIAWMPLPLPYEGNENV